MMGFSVFKSTPGNKIITFLVITIAISCIFYYLIITAGSLQAGGGLFVFLLMWTPGVAAIITQLIFERTIKGFGWKPGKFKYLALAYLIPLGYCLVVYGFTWITGLGRFPSMQFVNDFMQKYPGMTPAISILVYSTITATVGFVFSMFSALGEEIGWRGLLVPELAKLLPFSKVALISGTIWAAWHMPLIFFSDYNLPGLPSWYAGLMFLILVIGISFVFAWLRLKSGSLWTAVVFHASHNIFVQSVFTPLTGQTPITPYIIDEFGCGLALLAVVLAVIFWRKQNKLTMIDNQ